MYLKFGSIHAARYLFDQIPHRDRVSWNTMMSGYVKMGLYSEAFHLFRQLQLQGLQPDGFIIVTLLTACDRSGFMVSTPGLQIHGFIVKTNLFCNVFVTSALLHLYGTYGVLSDASSLFGEIPERNTISWNCLMLGYSSNGVQEQVLRIYRDMRREGVECNQTSFTTVVSSCGLLGDELFGHQLHAHVVRSGFQCNVSVANSLISMLGSFGNVEDAKYIFDGMEERDTISWNAIISAYSHNRLCEESLKSFHCMRRANAKPNPTTLSCLVYACNSVHDLKWGMGIQGLAFKIGFDSSVCLGTTLVTLYSESGSLKDAELLFREMPEKDLISWSTVMSMYVRDGKVADALKLLAELHGMNMIRNRTIIANALTACSFPEGMIVHALTIRAGLHEDLLIGNALVTMYGNCGMIGKAEQIFCTMPMRDIVTWNALIGSLSENEEGQQAILFFKLMKEDGPPADYITIVNVLGCTLVKDDLLIFVMPIHAQIVVTGFEQDDYVQSSLLSMYAKCGDLASSNFVFELLEVKNTVSWNALVAANAHHGCCEKALKLFLDMHRAGLKLDRFSFSGSLAACGNLALLEEGQQIHNLIIKMGLESDFHVINASMDMYGKCGYIEGVLHMLPAPESRSLVSWNILLSAFSRHGYVKEARESSLHMLQVGPKPDSITFIFLLSAFNHAGLVDEGLAYFACMTSKYQILPRIEHYACVVDLLGRSGRLADAEKLINEMSIPPNDLIWRSLLSACSTHNNMELGKKAAEHLLALESLDDSAYILLSNVCAANGRWEEMEDIRKKMEMSNIEKKSASSWLRVNRQLEKVNL